MPPTAPPAHLSPSVAIKDANGSAMGNEIRRGLPAPLADLRRLLDRIGYRVVVRSRGWTECLIASSEEQWFGHGTTEDDALEDALRQMLPSALACTILAERFVSSPPPKIEVSTPATAADGSAARVRSA
jgi:hypothetical protein